MPKLFDFIGDLTYKKTHLLESDPENINDYEPFLVNRALSMAPETLATANHANMLHRSGKRAQYDFLYHILPQQRINIQWQKKDTADASKIKLVQQYCECTPQKAMAILMFIDSDYLQTMKAYFDTGGVK